MVREVNKRRLEPVLLQLAPARSRSTWYPRWKAVGSAKNLSIAERALQIFGKRRSLSEDDRSKQLARVTRDGENNPWDALEGEFYENPEDLDAMISGFIARNQAEFGRMKIRAAGTAAR
jgi:hypothetical protein